MTISFGDGPEGTEETAREGTEGTGSHRGTEQQRRAENEAASRRPPVFYVVYSVELAICQSTRALPPLRLLPEARGLIKRFTPSTRRGTLKLINSPAGQSDSAM